MTGAGPDDAFALDALIGRAVPQAICVVRALDGRIVHVNRWCEQMLGYAAGLLVGQDFGTLAPQDDAEAFRAFVRTALQRDGEAHRRVQLARSDGSGLPCLAHVGITRHASLDRLWVIALEDVTPLTRAETGRRQAEQWLRHVLEAAPVGLWIADTEGRILLSNTEARRIWSGARYAPEPQFEGYREWRTGSGEAIARALRGESSIDEVVEVECLDGTRKTVLNSAMAVHDAQGVIVGAISMDHDITERRRTEDALVRARSEAETANRAKSDFLAMMSHEIRTPMNGVTGMLGLLLDTVLTDEQRELAQLAETSAESLLAIFNDILDFSRIESGRIQLEASTFSLRDLVQDVARLMASRVSSDRVQVVAHYPPTVRAAFSGDSLRIRQILMNLVGNAVKFTHQGQVLVDVETAEDVEACDVRIAVADTGIGIPANRLASIFERFSQADASTAREFGGTGLGLAIVKRLVELMGGSIGVESQPGVGSRFWIHLRLNRPDGNREENGGVAATAGAMRSPPASHEGARVLVAEDNEVSLLLIRRLLERMGCQVDSVRDGREAVERALSERYDLVLLDLQMPGMDGCQAAAAIRQREQSDGHVPIVAVSASVLSAERERCVAAGMDDFATKPLYRRELERVLAEWLPLRP